MSKEKITIVIALYNPNLNWLEEELISIQKQTYRDFKVIAWNDNPDDAIDYAPIFERCLKNIPFQIFKGDINLGSNKVFEKLTQKVETPYIAYCDQDDIWHPKKLEILLMLLQNENVTLVFSDMFVIDEKSQIIADSITKVRPRQIIYSGIDMESHLLAKNFITGCTVLMRTDVAQKAIPFPNFSFHDWWLAAFAMLSGRIEVAKKPLVKYRIHRGNQSKPLANIYSKKDYFDKYIMCYQQFINSLQQVFPDDGRIYPYLQWSNARVQYFLKRSWNAAQFLWGHKNWAPSMIKFELLLPFIPEYVFSRFIQKIQNTK